MKTTRFFFWFRPASLTAPRRKQFLKESVTILARVVSLVISFILVLQCVALPTLVTAETGGLRSAEQSKKTRKKKKRRAKANKGGQQTSRRVTGQNKASATARPAAKENAADKLAQPPVVTEKTADKLAPAVAKEKDSDNLTSGSVVKEPETAKLPKRPVKDNETDKHTSRRAVEENKSEASTSRPMMIVPPFWNVSPSSATSVETGALATKTAELALPQSSREYKPVQREITVLPSVNLRELATQKSLGMNSTAPAELKPIHPPVGLEEGARKGVTIHQGPPKEKGWETFWSKRGDKAIIASVPSPATTRTFKSDHLSIGFIPPDTMGAVGLNHVVTVTNEKVVIHDRNGVILSNVPLNNFWAGTGGIAPLNAFDPKILYDRFNDRFIFVVVANSSNPTSATLLAVSQTGDPTGTWIRYAIDADATAVAGGGAWADFPSVGFNMNWITISINRFGFGSVSGYQGPSIYVVPKALAYAGTLGAVSVFEQSFASCLALPAAAQGQALSCGFTYSPAVTEDNTTNDHYIAEDWNSTAGQLRMTRITGTALAPTVDVGYQFPQSPYAWRFNAALIAGTGGYVPQRQQNVYAPSGSRAAGNDSRLSASPVLRNGSFWAVHHVMLARIQTPAGTTVGGTANPDVRTAIQWWQINPTIVNTATGTPPIQRNIIVDMRADNCHNGVGGQRAGCSTANQSGDFFTFPSISVNAINDVLIGYSRFSPFTLPKAGYSFRAAGDPVNTMRDPMVFREGQGNYNIGSGSGAAFNIRWGDYSSAMVDPLNDTDFWTIQEYALDQRDTLFGPGNFAGLWSTWWALIKPSTSAGTYGYGTGLIISEFRMRGPAGPRDEFVELINPTDSPITVFSSDGTDGWTLAYSNPAGTITVLATIPNGTVIPARGHYLITNEVRAAGIAPYSLSLNPTGNPVRTADSDAMWTPDNADNGGFAIFRTANTANFILATRMDAVGFSTLPAGSIYREGNGLPPCAGSPAAGEQVSFTRKGTAGTPQDTNSNENDFDFVSSTGTSAQICQPLSPGTPTPLNLDSPPSAP